MRKHFLILMLLALLPLVGWAQTNVSITLYDFAIDYGDDEPTAATMPASAYVVSGANWNDVKGYLTFTRIEEGANVGNYAYTLVQSGGTETYTIHVTSNNAKLQIKKLMNGWTSPLTISDWIYGQSPNAPTAVAAQGTPSYSYKKSDASEYSSDVPTNAGSYTVKAVVEGTENYTGLETTANFIISKATDATVAGLDNSGWTYDEASHPLLTVTTSAVGGVMHYSLESGVYGEGSTVIPTAVNANTTGYTVYYKLVGDENHEDVAENSINVIVKKAPGTDAVATAPVVANGLIYDGTEKALIATLGTTKGGEKFAYKLAGGSYSQASPKATDAGTYTIYRKISASANYNPLAEAVLGTVTIAKASQEWNTELAADNSVFGEPLNVTEAVAQYESADVTLWYKKTSEDDGAYTTDAPTAVGEYNVKAVAAETANYAALTSDVATFSITPAQPAVTSAPVVKTGLTYNGTDLELTTAGAATHGTIQFSVNGDEYAAGIPVAKNAGTYTISYKVKGADGYSDLGPFALPTVEIAKVGLNYALGNQTSEFKGAEITPNGNYALMAGSFAPGESLSTLGITFTFPGAPTNVEDGATFTSLDVKYADENAPKNYVFSFTGSSILTITPKAFDEAMIKNFAASADWDNTAKAPGYTVEDGEPSIITADDYDVVITKGGAEVTAANVKDAGEYTYTFTPKANYAGDAVEKIFTINGKTLDAAMLKTPATWTETATYNGSNKVPASIVLKDGSMTLGNAEYELVITNTKDEDADGNNDVVTEAIDVDTYTFTFTGKGNYTGSFTKTLTIEPKALAEGDFALAATTAEYKAANLLPNVTTLLAKDVDYTVAVTNDAAEVVTEAKDVDTYTFTFTGKGNYTGDIQKTFAITPATVLVSVAANISKDYDGTTAFGAQKPSLEYSGLKGGDTKDVVTFDDTEVAAISAKDVEAAPGSYDLEVDVAQLRATNYIFAANAEITRTFTINAVGLVITFANNYDEDEITDAYKKVYGEEDHFDAEWKNANIGVGGALNDEEKAAIIAGINVVRAEGEDVNTYKLSIEVTDAEVFDNYNAPSCGNATFAITPATLQVALKNDEGKEYDGAVPSVTVTKEKLAVSGYKFGDNNTAISKVPTATIVGASKNAGSYVIELDGAEAANYVFQYSDARYTITPIELEANVYDQTVTKNATELPAADAFDIVNKTAIVGEDDIEAKLERNASTATVNAGIADGIKLSLGNKNYTLKGADEDGFVYGKLIVIDAANIVLTPYNKAAYTADENVGKEQEAALKAANGKEANVTFGSFAMAAGRWYTLVLPFDVTPGELLTKFGGVPEVMDKSKTSAKAVSFKLNLTEQIAANTPFIIQLYEAKNMNTISFTKTIKYTGAAPKVVDDDSETRLVGTYTGIKGYDETFVNNKQWYMAIGNGEWYTSADGYTRPTGAFLVFEEAPAAGAPCVSIEDINGAGTTAIMNVNYNKAINAEGWYTVNGMKLDNAPVEKGVYIKDGKKVVIK